MSVEADEEMTIFSNDQIEIQMIRVEGGGRMRLVFGPSGVAAMGTARQHEVLLMKVKAMTLLQLLELKPELVRRYPELARWSRELRMDDGQTALNHLADGLSDRTYLSLLYLRRRGSPEIKAAAVGNYRLMSDPFARALVDGALEELLNDEGSKS